VEEWAVCSVTPTKSGIALGANAALKLAARSFPDTPGVPGCGHTSLGKVPGLVLALCPLGRSEDSGLHE
jgi:hypothetical protein